VRIQRRRPSLMGEGRLEDAHQSPRSVSSPNRRRWILTG
jgi:hypothetical protein